MKAALALITISILTFFGPHLAVALDPGLDVSQYAHSAWTVKDGFSLGNIYAITQTPDGYLWLGTEFGLVRFDGLRTVPWQPPVGQHLPYQAVYRLLAGRDGTLWISTFLGFVTLKDGKLGSPPALADQLVTSLFEDSEGTVWAGAQASPRLGIPTRLCAMRRGSAKCFGEDGSFGHSIEALYEDGSGNLWAAAESALWKIKPGSPRLYAKMPKNVTALGASGDGGLLLARYGASVMQVVGNEIRPYPIRSAAGTNILQYREVNSNKLLRDRDGGLWIGTVERGLIHVHEGRTDVFTKSEGLSGDVVLALYEDREGTIWVSTTGGLDRFRELSVATISVKQGLSSDATRSVVAARDGSIWVGAHDGLTRWENGKATIFREGNGLPDNNVQSLVEDERGRIWVSTPRAVAYFNDGRFVSVAAANEQEVHYIAGDKAGNIWFSESKNLLHFRGDRLVEQIPWSALRRVESASALAAGRENGELWLGFWQGGGVSFLKDSRLRESYTSDNGMTKDAVQDLRLDRDGTVWAATATGLNRIKDGRVATLTSSSGLPCDTIHWSTRDDDGFFWLYTACGLVRISPTELDAWIADPKHSIQTQVWDAADGVRLRSVAATAAGPRLSKSPDGKLWFLTGEGVQVIDPRHLVLNKIPPPVHIERIVADREIYWQSITGAAVANLRLPPRVHDLLIDYTALSLVAPEKVHFKYKLQGQDSEWREVVNDREVQYSNLRPGSYQFRVIASNNSGVWNDQGDTLDFSVDPAYYQTNWFRALCVAAFLALLWAAYRLRVRQLHYEFDMKLEARVSERTRIARDLHDTLLQSFHGLLLRFQTVSLLLPERPIEAKEKLESAIEQAAGAITEGRDAVQGLRASTVEGNDLARSISTLGEEFENDSSNHRPATFRVAVEGQARDFHPIVRDEIYKIVAEALHNAFHHAQAKQVEVEIRYDDEFRLRVRDDGKGMDAAVLSSHGLDGHYGLRGMRERAALVGGKLAIWSKADSGTEVELIIPASKAYTKSARRFGSFARFSKKYKDANEKIES